MHIEILTEDSSSKALLEHLMPMLVDERDETLSWRTHAYRGIGRIPAGLTASSDASKRILLDQLPRLLRGYVRTPGVDAVVVLLDTDDHDCVTFLAELQSLAELCGAVELVLFRLAIEETEAWYLGDRAALQRAYPNARMRVLDAYAQDSICGTWELVADAIYPGGLRAVRGSGWPLAGQIKHEWADRIGPFLNPEANLSPSFAKLRDGIPRLAGRSLPDESTPAAEG
jgi:hypothetical protein